MAVSRCQFHRMQNSTITAGTGRVSVVTEKSVMGATPYAFLRTLKSTTTGVTGSANGATGKPVVAVRQSNSPDL
jgi:hypothetical protein